MTKTHAEFLEELKEFIYKNTHEDYNGNEAISPNIVVEKIEQLQAEQKGDQCTK